ncbi:TetR/AcrR family transcriptional regulator [Bacteroides cellulosilyticus]|uniref:TetR/AcrR family transcriptional regulator n=1 Tax=Bacteroides cellulosilyticus TaxID=246787 RepID=UPI003563B10C
MELKRSEMQLIEAVSTIITEEGFSKIGINKIARTAGCDKVLIYRYFGNLDGLITTWAKKHDFYIQAYDAFINKVETVSQANLREITKEILLSQLHFTKENKMHQELLLWELSGGLKFNAIRNLREENGHKLQKMLELKADTKGLNISMYITLLIASINYIVLSTLEYPQFNGIDFSNDTSWTIYESTLCDYIDMLFEKINL